MSEQYRRPRHAAVVDDSDAPQRTRAHQPLMSITPPWLLAPITIPSNPSLPCRPRLVMRRSLPKSVPTSERLEGKIDAKLNSCKRRVLKRFRRCCRQHVADKNGFASGGAGCMRAKGQIRLST